MDLVIISLNQEIQKSDTVEIESCFQLKRKRNNINLLVSREILGMLWNLRSGNLELWSFQNRMFRD